MSDQMYPPGTKFHRQDERVRCSLCKREIDSVIIETPDMSPRALRESRLQSSRHAPIAGGDRQCPAGLSEYFQRLREPPPKRGYSSAA